MYSYKNNINQDIYVIKDPASQLSLIVFMVIVGMITLFTTIYLIVSSRSIGDVVVGLVIIGILLGIMAWLAYAYKADSEGVELNLVNRTMSFPGGGISANNLSDYVNPEFLLQSVKRKTINLDAISEIRRRTEKISSHKGKNRGASIVLYYIEFVGTFGGAHIMFYNEKKRNELFNAIRQVNEMGTPLFNVAGTGNPANTTTNFGGTVFGKSPVTPSVGKTNTSASSFFGKKP